MATLGLHSHLSFVWYSLIDCLALQRSSILCVFPNCRLPGLRGREREGRGLGPGGVRPPCECERAGQTSGPARAGPCQPADRLIRVPEHVLSEFPSARTHTLTRPARGFCPPWVAVIAPHNYSQDLAGGFCSGLLGGPVKRSRARGLCMWWATTATRLTLEGTAVRHRHHYS